MPTSQIMVKRLGALRPTDDSGTEALQKIGDGELVKVSWSRPRNIRFHRKFFAMLQIILANQEHYKSMDDLLDVCKLRIGHVRIVETAKGIERFPASISFANMDETEFSAFYDRAVDWVLREVLPGLQRQHLDAEVEAELVEFAA
ncbi:hypothetical protein LCGC14_2217480 [marine sediment metagenome]|uniref:DUF1367 family protein n=1 Tax=marine sediment metagenome TaxID=412755 RepID=A0A0F9FPM4_9ZZZZ